jgi:hypothetical protein
MQAWQPLPPREGEPPRAEQFRETFTPNLRRAALDWVGTHLLAGQDAKARLINVANALDIPLHWEAQEYTFWWDQIRAQCSDDRALLNLIHVTLDVVRTNKTVYRPHPSVALEQMFAYAHFAWMATEDGLQRRINATAQEAFNQATARDDSASEQLREAWDCAYRFYPNPSDAWDHAIKAVEATMIPAVIARQHDPHLGKVIGQLDHQGELYDTTLKFNQTTPPVNPPTTPVQAIVGMLRLLYPNPDRHEVPARRTPSLQEARMLVGLAVAIVGWSREGEILKRQR